MTAEKKSILIVDDDKRILYAFKKALEKTNYNLLFADSGDAAFALLQSESIDLAIVDLRMPIISGYEILEKLKKDYPAIFRIALIGYVDESKILKALSKNLASSYIIKPWNKSELTNTVSYYVNLYNELKERGILEAINSIDALPTIPEIYFKISKAVEENYDMDKIAELIEMDHSISAKVIQIVNSAYFNIRTASIRKALVYLGINNIQNIIMSQSVFSSVKKEFANPLWLHAEMTNKIMLLIYNNILDKKLDEDLRSVGLFHDIGKVVLINDYSNGYYDLCKVYTESEDCVIQEMEKDKFGVSHEEIGYYFMKLWGVAEEIPEAALYHHDPFNPAVKNKELIMVIHLANHYSKVLLGCKVNEEELDKRVFEELNINREYFENVVKNLKV